MKTYKYRIEMTVSVPVMSFFNGSITGWTERISTKTISAYSALGAVMKLKRYKLNQYPGCKLRIRWITRMSENGFMSINPDLMPMLNDAEEA